MFAERLKKARNKTGQSQAELASKLHISQQAYAKYETGASSPNPDMLSDIARELNVTPNYLLGYSSENEIAPPEPDEATRKLIDLISSLPADQKTGLLLALQGLSGPQS